MSGTVGLCGISILSSFSVECSPSVLLIAVVKSLVLYWDEIVVVLLGTEFVSSCKYVGPGESLTESPCE